MATTGTNARPRAPTPTCTRRTTGVRTVSATAMLPFLFHGTDPSRRFAVFANRSSGFGIGMTALDDVFRVHAHTHQYAMRNGPRRHGMDCLITDPPSIELRDRHLALPFGETYRMEWAVYILANSSCTDYFCVRECLISGRVYPPR